jgi:hypothetical protein
MHLLNAKDAGRLAADVIAAAGDTGQAAIIRYLAAFHTTPHGGCPRGTGAEVG